LILAVAHEVGPRAVAYAERLLGDGALALDLFEEAAAAVTEALKRKATVGGGPVRDLERYLFRTYLRKVGLVRGKQARLDRLLRANALKQPGRTKPAQAEISLLFDEIMATYDNVTREIVNGRLEGFLCREIAAKLGLSTHAVEVRYSRALAKARKLLWTRRSGL